MRKILKLNFFFLIAFLFCSIATHGQTIEKQEEINLENTKQNLAVIWTSGDRDVALKMVFMYTNYSSKMKWWDKINLVVWGPSAKLLSEDKELQDYVAKMQKSGVTIFACKACADSYGVSTKLESLGIDVKYMGKPLTEYLQKDYKVITF
ncbi:MAG: DsrE family protein [Labilibaculum sp.]|nr:DsrE family protein [Labilibaculum sp.]MBI9057474.1 DsrE family protein [Labilibaculum sp.]